MPESIFASKAEVGQQYVTKGGWPVTVLEIGTRVIVRNDFTEVRSKLWLDQLLWPYDAKLISKEAIDMSRQAKATGAKKTVEKSGARGGDRGTTNTKNGIVLHRQMKGARHEVLLKDGILLYRTKEYPTLKAVAEAIRGKAISGSGRSFFGLRSEPNITLGKEVIKALSTAQDKAKAEASEKAKTEKAAKVKKVKAKKETDYDDDDEGKAPASVGAAVAKVFGRGRK